MLRNRSKWLGSVLAFLGAAALTASAADTATAQDKAVFDSMFGELKLIDEINCADDKTHEFKDYPAGVSKVEKILGKDCRVLPTAGAAKYFSYIIGKGKGLKAGKMYVLVVEYPEDKPRAFTISNKGNETNLGVATGNTVGDALVSKYVGSNPEMIQYPLSGKYEATKAMFNLHDVTAKDEKTLRRHDAERTRSPKDGFSVAIAQFGASGEPFNSGAAVSRIALYEVLDPAKAVAEINYPPADLPKRYIFWREEMGDGMVSGKDDSEGRGIMSAVDYYKYKYNLMRFLAINTFCKDMLEFGHNQGWDSDPYGGSRWYNQTQYPERWEEIIDMLAPDKSIYILPYYEYAGSIGQDKEVAIGSQCRAMNVNGKNKYTHISWSGAPKCNADLADPDFIKDASKLLDCTQTRFKNKANFLGAWFRPRPEANPISFNDKDIARYNKETGKKVTREMLDKDKKAQDEYIAWFMLKRREWMKGVQDYLRKNVTPDAKVFYTVDTSEPGKGIGQFAKGAVVDDPGVWKKLMASQEVKDALKADNKKNAGAARGTQLQKFSSVTKFPAKALTSPWPTWGEWRWDLGNPYADPWNYKNDDGLNMSYSFNRLYTVDDPDSLESFRSKDGLLMVRHYSLNENNLNDMKDKEILGYYCGQFDRAREHGMLAEARALINGDPRYLGYLAPMNMGRLFPEYTRAFNQAFLALPAVPSTIVKDCSADKNIGVREYKTEKHGTYYAVVNMGLNDVKGVSVKLPTSGKVVNLVTGQEIPVENGEMKLDFYSGQVYALNVK